MSGAEVVPSPVLVGRDDALRRADRRLAAAVGGAGHLLFVAGEAGIGKTRLLDVVVRRARAAQVAVLRAAAFPGDADSSGGLLLDLASDLTTCGSVPVAALGEALAGRLRAPSEDGDRHRRRRLLIQDVVDLLVHAGRQGPTLVALEDLHWADALSLEVLAHLAGRVTRAPVLVLAAVRTDELFPGSSVAELRLRLLNQRLADEITLTRLGVDETATVVSSILGRPAPTALVRALHDRSDGIPLHVEELLAGRAPDGPGPPAGSGAPAVVDVPDTLHGAITARVARLSPAAQQVARAAAVIGRSFDLALLTSVAGLTPDQVASAVRELRTAYLVLPGADPDRFDFRHALIRDSLYAETDAHVRRRLHAVVARAANPHDGASASAHYELAGESAAAFRCAVEAARGAAAVSARGDVLELLRRAERNLPADLPDEQRIELYAALGEQAAAADDNEAAAAAYRTAHELCEQVADHRRAADLVPALVGVDHLLGHGLTDRIARLRRAEDSLTGLPAADEVRARLSSATAAAYMLDRRLEESIAHGERSRRLSGAAADSDTALNTAATLGSVFVFAGRDEEGWELLADTVTRAREAGREAEAARAYRMIGTSASVLVEYDRAETWLGAGIDYAAAVELGNHQHYMTAHLAHVRWATGRWADAQRGAEHALADGRGGVTTAITARYVLGYVALGRGESATATAWLEEAYAAGSEMGELQRLSPPLWGLAELARCTGEPTRALERCRRGLQASVAVADAAYLFPFLLTGLRAHLDRGDLAAAIDWTEEVRTVLAARGIPGTRPALDHADGLLAGALGDLTAAEAALRAATDGWAARRRYWEGGWARLDLAGVAVRARRVGAARRLLIEVRDEADAVGARALVDAADQLEQAFPGGPVVEVPWAPLSRREFEIAGLVAAGLTNPQIAARLVLAPKTVSAHVAHMLAKLGVGRRAEVAAWWTAVDREQP